MSHPFVETKEMTVGYRGVPLIRDIALCVHRGEILTLIGPNGAGKSTILKSLIRQLALIGGTVYLDGRSLHALPERELARGFGGQHDAAREAVGKQVRQRAGLVFMRMGQEQIAAGTNLVGRQVRQFIPAITTLIAAIHDEGRVPALNIITVALLRTGFAR